MLRALLGRSSFRAALAAAAGAALFAFLTGHQWPWWAALPAAILFTIALFGAMLFALYSYIRKWHNAQRHLLWEAYKRHAAADDQSPADRAGKAHDQ
ncbi:MAG: hypothetical protein H5T86_14205 [Armatimonadetes bacterium]|nr:hypothetical protein [Armatimonadota bacterium]